MARIEVFLLLIASITVPVVHGAGCPDEFSLYGDICFSAISNDAETWQNATKACVTKNSTLAIIRDYRTQANLVMLLWKEKKSSDDVYIGYRSTTEDPGFQWPTNTDSGPGDIGINQFNPEFTRWGFGQPDGPVVLAKQDYCAVMVGSSTKQLGLWYDVPCNEKHKYICSMDVDPALDSIQTPKIQDKCPKGWYGYSDKTCFKLVSERDQWTTYDLAKKSCLNDSESGYSLATILNGFESALIQVLMNEKDVPYAWIGLSSKDSNDEFEWESGYPIAYTSWGPNEPSTRDSEGCVRDKRDGDGWDDTTCEDTAPYVCRFDKNRPPFPTADPRLANYDCPKDEKWVTYAGSDSCYHLYPDKEYWGFANFRCMQNHKSRLVSISSAAENEYVLGLALEAAKSEKFNRFIWIGLTRTLSAQGDWGNFAWIDGKTEMNYAPWAREEPDGDMIADSEKPETCVLMSLNEGGTWADKFCQFEKFRFVCELEKRSKYAVDYCATVGGKKKGGDFVKEGDYCYGPSNIFEGDDIKKLSWLEAENVCRKKKGHLVSILSQAEQTLVRELATSYARSYWIGLREYGNQGKYNWSDGTPFNSALFSEFPGGGYQNTAKEEFCAETLIWQNGIWGTSACGNALPYICKKPNKKRIDLDQLTRYPTTGSCPHKYFQLGIMCYRFKGREDETKTWLDARDNCRLNYDGSLATISNAGQQAFLTSIIKVFDGSNLWIGLNSIGIHDQYHWTDGARLTYRNWREGAPNNILPISDPNSQTCVTMMSAEDYAGKWNDGRCNDKLPYLCQAPLGAYNATPYPPYPGECPDKRYRPYFKTCLLMESKKKVSFNDARENCSKLAGKLMSAADRFELALMIASLYRDNMKKGDEAWIGMQRHATTKAFRWIDNWPILFTQWGPNEPSNIGDCVAVTRDGFWGVRNCDEKKYYFCEYATGTPPKPPPPVVGVCAPGYTEIPKTDKCVLFKTSSLEVLKDEVLFTCQRDHEGNMPSIHNQNEEDFIRKGAAEVYGTDAQIWLGIDRNEKGENKWNDKSNMDYTNWMAGEPNPVDGNTQCVVMNLEGGWADVDCEIRANFICMGPKFPVPNAANAVSQVTAWALLLLGGAIAMATRC